MLNQAEVRYLTLIAQAEHWERKGMYEVAAIYYNAAMAVDLGNEI